MAITPDYPWGESLRDSFYQHEPILLQKLSDLLNWKLQIVYKIVIHNLPQTHESVEFWTTTSNIKETDNFHNLNLWQL